MQKESTAFNFNETESLVKSTLEQFGQNENIIYRVRCLTESHLTGGDVIIVVISFVLSGVISGVLAEMGKELWDKIKILFTKLKNRESSTTSFRLEFVIKEAIDGSQIEIQYVVNTTGNPNKINQFVTTVEKTISDIKKSNTKLAKGKKHMGTVRYIYDGRSLEKKWE